MNARQHLRIAVAIVVIALVGCEVSTSIPDTHGEALALVNGTVIDGTGAAPVPNAVVVIRAGRILFAGPGAGYTIPGDARVIDVRGGFILPGFFNAHVHSGYRESNLAAWAQAGVTTVRDLAGPRQFSLVDSLSNDSRLARVVAAGPMVTVPGGYPIVPWGSPNALTVTSPEDARAQVAQLITDGADVVKIALDSGANFGRTIPMLTPEEALAVVQTAHSRGVAVSAHVQVSQELSRALDAGADDIAHMVVDSLPDSLIQRMVSAGVYWVPTLELWQVVGQGFDTIAIANLQRFVQAGGNVALGTDFNGYAAPFDLGMPMREVLGMQRAGMSPMQIIVAATRNAAHVCNLQRDLGTLEPGKVADLLILNADPLADIRSLTDVRAVIKNGVVIR